MSVLIIAGHDQTRLNPDTLNLVTAGLALGSVDICILGNQIDKVAEQAAGLKGVRQVLSVNSELFEHQLAENLSPTLHAIAQNYKYVLAAANSYGKDIIPRLAALLDCAPLSEVVAIDDANTFFRPVYSGKALARVKSNQSINLMTIQPVAFASCETHDNPCPIVIAGAINVEPVNTFVSLQCPETQRPELSRASKVVSGGRGLGSKENFLLIEQLADKLGAAVGGSRAAVDAGFLPNSFQVGQSGKTVAPELYIAIGLSGAVQHQAGMNKSKTIVAINKDPNAPIFDIADVGLVADLFDAVPELIDLWDDN